MGVVLMRVLESAPDRYDRGINILTLGKAVEGYRRLSQRIQPDWHALDIGSGTGGLALLAAARGAQVVAIDVNPEMLDQARRKAEEAGLSDRVSWREMGVAEMDTLSPDASFDVVCSSLCFSELTSDERIYALKQAHRLLRPGGLLLLADEVQPLGLARLIVGVIRFPLVLLTWVLTQTTTRAVPDLEELVRQNGFEVTAVRTALLGSWAELEALKS
jgi:demethylmenaquinone methyltransferase/2-methoxy-6-polyprenyl-1,4-benzoquinol methylase